MSRSLWKPNYIHKQVLTYIDKSIAHSEICVQNRSTLIVPSRLGKQFQIYNGVRWFAITIQSEIIGHLLGEFAPTRKRPVIKKKKVAKKLYQIQLNGTKNTSKWSSCRSLS